MYFVFIDIIYFIFMKKTILFLGLIGLLSLIGFGCKKSVLEPAGPKLVNLENVKDSKTAAEKINFVKGSVIEVEQFGGTKRTLNIERFAPDNFASFSWSLKGDDKKDVVGKVKNFHLNNVHKLYPIAYYPPKEIDDVRTSGIWLCTDTYLAVNRTKSGTSEDFGFTDSQLYTDMQKDASFKKMIDKLKKVKLEASKTTEVDLLQKVSDETVDLIVNDKKVQVDVFKAKNWFGEITVLKNSQNPLILEMKLDPNLEVALGKEDYNLLSSLVNYKINVLSNVQ